jgi:hypothetical protein
MPVSPWKTLSSRYLIRDPWITLRADNCEMASGTRLNRVLPGAMLDARIGACVRRRRRGVGFR